MVIVSLELTSVNPDQKHFFKCEINTYFIHCMRLDNHPHQIFNNEC